MKQRVIWLVLVALGIGTFLGAELDSKSWNQVKKQFRVRYSSKVDSEREAAVRALSGKDDRRVVGLVFAVLGNSREKQFVKEAAIQVLGTFRDEKAVTEIFKKWKKLRDAGVRGQVLSVLAENIGGKKLEDILLKAIKSRDPVTRVVAVDALGAMKSEKGFKVIDKALKDPVKSVQVSAIQALAGYGDKRAVEALIEGMGKVPSGDRLEDDYARALHGLTGKNLGSSQVQWQSWWNANKDKPLSGPGHEAARPSGGGGGGDESITFFGIKLKSRRVIFVIDLSGSMDKKLGRKDEMKQKLGVVVTGEGGKEAQKKQGLDWGKIDKKVDLAKEELVRAIESLRKDAHFNIIWYNTSVGVWKDGSLVEASPKAKSDAISWIRRQKPQGETDIRGALKKAIFLQSSKAGEEGGPGVVLTGDLEEGGDTIVFLTDGWGFKNQKEQDPGKTLEAVKKWNKIPKMKIYTVGISDQPGEHDRELLRKLAEQNGGSYRAP